MQGLSERQYAAHRGVSRGAVQKARTSGRLALHADGSIDAAGSDARWSSSTDPAMARGSIKSVPTTAIAGVRDTLAEAGQAATGATTFMQARTANEVLKAQERRVRLQKMKGELIDRARVVGQVFALARTERDAWAQWPARVAGLMAADLGVEAGLLRRVLENHVRQHLATLAEPRLTVD